MPSRMRKTSSLWPMIPQKIFGPLVFGICLALGFGPLIWGDWMLIHDNTNAFLPYRHFASVELRNGCFPFWNPWINLGYPFSSDPQSGAWYPVVWLLSIFSVYTPRLIAIEWLFHVVMGGIGFARWMKLGWGIRSDVRWILGCTYAMSGFFTGTAQILPFVIAGAWMPWVLGSFHALVKQPGVVTALSLAMSMSMLLLGGYPSFPLTATYILMLWGLSRCWHLRSKGKDLRKFIEALLVSGCVAMLLCSGFLMGFLSDAPLTSRMDSSVVAELDQGIWSPWSWLSLLVPTAHALPSEWIQTDVSNVNGFVGWLPFLILAMGWRRLSRFEVRLGLGLVVAAVLTSLGAKGELHTILSGWVPGFNMFRHTAQFRLYAILLVLLGAALILHRELKSNACRRLVLLCCSLALLTVGVAWMMDVPMAWQELWAWGPQGRLAPQEDVLHLLSKWSVLLLPWMTLIVAWGRAQPRQGTVQVLSLQAVMLVLGTWAVFGSTVASKKDHAALGTQLQTLAQSPWAGHQTLVREMGPHAQVSLWRNAPMVMKQASHQGYNPFQLAGFKDVVQSPLYPNLEGHPIMWCSIRGEKANVTVTQFEASHVEAEVQCPCHGEGELVWAQNHHPNWRVSVDGEPAQPLRWNEGLLAAKLNCDGADRQAVHVAWDHNPGLVQHAVWLTLCSWILVALAMLIWKRN